jgi:succinate dehydrogenase / fumarate reductase, cytochrome b subunit
MAKKITPYRMRTGTWAFVLHRLSGLGLLAYLPLHIWVTGSLVGRTGEFDRYMAFLDRPLFHFLEWGLFGVVLYHALNGLRVIALDAGWWAGLPGQKRLFWALIGAGAAAWMIALPFMMGWGK